MRLFDSIGPNPHVVRMAAAEKGLVIDKVTLDIMAGENRSSDYAKRVPSGGTPALELDDGTLVSEILAIAEYFEDIQPNPPIIGSTPAERAVARMWTRRIDLYICEPMANGFRASEGRPMFAPRMTLVSEAAAAELKAIAAEKLLWLDGLMSGDFVCGNRFTIADILLFAFVQFGAAVGQPMPAAARWLPAWRDRVAARPSAAA
ncbi:glutathione S-transferase family protein [Sandarakinorhabdus oryzae]|uniref:glutathione S-transferase family protein n=1 Tax=Sandarakinorhabdus oryzae TaxID=2675220 RepID=UPI0012E163AA|nr:glutathione S-transferase family protein [Sandarakinorhabdus oryzae]